MGDTDDLQERLVRDALGAYKEEHSELSEIWHNLDGKAQGTIAVSGIFLAGMLAFVRALSERVILIEKLLFTATVGLLSLSIIFALLVLLVRSVSSAPLGESLDELTDDLLRAEDGTSTERLLDFSRDYARMWKTTNREVEKVNEKKAGHLIKAQILLVVAIGCAVFVTLSEIWN